MINRVIFVLALGATTLVSSNVFAEDLREMNKFGIWTVYCSNPANATPKYGNCSIVTGGHADNDSSSWAKIAIALTGRYTDPEMTIRVPFVRNIGDGISIGLDDKQVGRAFIRVCSTVACETTIRIDERLNSRLGASGSISVEYKTSDDQSVVLLFDREGLAAAIAYINKLMG